MVCTIKSGFRQSFIWQDKRLRKSLFFADFVNNERPPKEDSSGAENDISTFLFTSNSSKKSVWACTIEKFVLPLHMRTYVTI
jgi:hypothetical protein